MVLENRWRNLWFLFMIINVAFNQEIEGGKFKRSDTIILSRGKWE